MLNSAAAVFVPKSDDNSDQNTNNQNQNPWNTVIHRKKRKSALKGSKQVSGSFKGVQDSKDLYVGRCNPEVKENDIIKYIQDELKCNVIACSVISKTAAPVKAFKVSLKSNELEKLLDAALWPEYIRVRKYLSKFNERKPNSQ